MPAFTDAQVRNWIEYGGDDLYLFYSTVTDESFPELGPHEKRELFLEVLEYCLQKRYLLLKEHPEFVEYKYSKMHPGEKGKPKQPHTPKEFVEYYRISWPDPTQSKDYDIDVMINLEMGGRMWWTIDGNEPTEWFNDYPENFQWPRKNNPTVEMKDINNSPSGNLTKETPQ